MNFSDAEHNKYPQTEPNKCQNRMVLILIQFQTLFSNHLFNNRTIANYLHTKLIVKEREGHFIDETQSTIWF